MTKNLIEKINHPNTFLDTEDLTADEKKRMFAFFEQKGFTTSTFYLRFFRKGFSKWELLGIEKCKKQFLVLPDVAEALLEYMDEGDEQFTPNDKGYYYTLAQSDEPGVFYSCLKKVKGLCNKFKDFMDERGMCYSTVIMRFTFDNDWRPWEKEGIETILKQFIDEQSC